jgi:signal transduction histidine kinase
VKKIFEPFYTTRSNGTGLGLSVSYGIIKNHEGDIQVFSELGKGTRFMIEFPILAEEARGKEGI